MATDPYGHGGAHVVPAPAIAPATVPFRPVSDEARTLAREGGAAYLRAGSIRADIARYNEEREANRPVPRPPQCAGVSAAAIVALPQLTDPRPDAAPVVRRLRRTAAP
jgi:hypothetical protein